MRTPLDIITRARAEVRALCIGRGRPGGRDWTMCVPVQPDDSDLVLSDAINLAEKEALVHGRDAKFWAESYAMVRDAITEHLVDFVHDTDEGEEAIIIAGIEAVAAHIRKLQGAFAEGVKTDWRFEETEDALTMSLKVPGIVLKLGGDLALTEALARFHRELLAARMRMQG